MAGMEIVSQKILATRQVEYKGSSYFATQLTRYEEGEKGKGTTYFKIAKSSVGRFSAVGNFSRQGLYTIVC